MKFSVIIPTLNEASRISETVENVAARDGCCEIIVVDGGSTDNTALLARAAGARVIESERGRGRQQNVGAKVAAGQALLFLHADCQLPEGALELAEQTLSSPGVSGGAFRTWHRPEKWRGRKRGMLLHLADFRSRYSPLPYGDQAIFVTADQFAAVGGFPELELMEDLAFARKLRARGRVVIVPARVSVSGRRFESAPIFQTALVNIFPLLYYCGVSPALLARLYGDPR